MPLDTSRSVMQSVGDYELVEKVAEGGMGAVYRARRRDTGEVVAIKIMPAHMAGNAVLVKRFEQEFTTASRLDHPNIVRALDFAETGGVPYLVMEFVEGESLGQKIQREGRLSETEAIRLIAQVAQGLHRAHKMNMVHRDIKPDNVMVTPDGTAKLCDLGLVKELEADLNLTRTGRGLGTPHFMAPEQFRNAKNADLRCDIYALGATLYMMVTGELPFKSSGPLDAWMKKMHNDLTPPRKVVPSLSERIDWAIRRAMSADPEQRPTSCREFVEDLTGRSTRKLPSSEGEVAAPSSNTDVWYLVYKDEDGVTHTVKGSVAAIRRSLKDGLLGDASNVRASRTKTGPFENLRSYPEFRDMVVAPAPLAVPRGGSSSTPPPDPPTLSPSLPPLTPRSVPSASRFPSSTPLPVPPPAPDADDDAMPHIELDAGRGAQGQGVEWMKWALLLLIAVATAVIAFFLLPT